MEYPIKVVPCKVYLKSLENGIAYFALTIKLKGNSYPYYVYYEIEDDGPSTFSLTEYYFKPNQTAYVLCQLVNGVITACYGIWADRYVIPFLNWIKQKDLETSDFVKLPQSGMQFVIDHHETSGAKIKHMILECSLTYYYNTVALGSQKNVLLLTMRESDKEYTYFYRQEYSYPRYEYWQAETYDALLNLTVGDFIKEVGMINRSTIFDRKTRFVQYDEIMEKVIKNRDR